jgi:hypothetical protein
MLTLRPSGSGIDAEGGPEVPGRHCPVVEIGPAGSVCAFGAANSGAVALLIWPRIC